jgi:hypothetical protein
LFVCFFVLFLFVCLFVFCFLRERESQEDTRARLPNHQKKYEKKENRANQEKNKENKKNNPNLCSPNEDSH